MTRRDPNDGDFEDTSKHSPHNDKPGTLGAKATKRSGGKPKIKRTNLHRYWMQTVGDTVEHRGGYTTIAQSLFYRHVNEKLGKFEPEEIRTGFQVFARAVNAGMVDVRGKVAWFVFIGRYQEWVHKTGPREMKFNDHPQRRVRLGATNTQEPPGDRGLRD